MAREHDEQLVSATIFARTIVGTARAAGVAVSTLLARLDVEQKLLEDPEGWLPARLVEEFLVLLGERTGHAAPGLWAGEQVSADTADLIGYAMRTSATLGDAYRTAARYYGLVGTGVEVYYRESHGHGHFVHAVTPERAEGRRHRDELILACVVTLGRRITGADWTPTYVTFQHPRPDDVRPHHALFGSQVRFGESSTQIAVDRETSALASHMADEVLHDILKRYARTLVHQRDDITPLVRDLRRAILGVLPAGELTIEALARSMGIGARTLQRRLSDHGTSYGEILRQTRQYLAEGFLVESATSIDEIAFLLGYANTPSFSRAFRQWAGMSPSDFRRREAGATG